MSQPNYALHFIPAAYATALVPHAYYIVRLMFGNGGYWSNVSPRQNWDFLKTKIPAEVYKSCTRARSAHLNGLESFSLFAAAMLAGTATKLPAEDMYRVGVQYLGARLLYTVLYISTSNELLSFLRTGVWGVSVALSISTLLASAKALNA